jgi:hypothetical protein
VSLETGRVAFSLPIEDRIVLIALDGAQVFVRGGSRSIACIDMGAGRVSWQTQLASTVTGDGVSGVRVRKDRLHVVAHVEREAGPSLLITPIDRQTGVLAPTTERPGELGHLPPDVFAAEVPLPRAIVGKAEVELVRAVNGVPMATRLPLPEGDCGSARIAAGRLFVLGRNLVALDRESIPSTPTASVSLRIVENRTAADVPATVTVAGQSPVVMVRHPVHGVTRITQSATSRRLAVGDTVILEDVTVLPGGVVRARSWRAAAAIEPLEEIVLGDEQLAPRAATVFESRTLDPLYAPREKDTDTSANERSRPALAPLAGSIERLFGQPVPLFARLAAACDASSRTRELWERLGPSFDVTPYEPELDDVSERLEHVSFAPFATDDGRVYYGVVRDPQTGARGVACLSPEGDHDFEWMASDFDTWLACTLGVAEPASAVRLLLAALDLPESFPLGHSREPPPWFEQ